MNVTLKEGILILNFKGNKQKMNCLLDPISNLYEGAMRNREGHNFPAKYIPAGHPLQSYRDKCVYVVAVYNTKSLNHELRHARYYVDGDYREEIEKEWRGLEERTKQKITSFLKKCGYSDKVLLDEYQAYKYTEKSNFFGIQMK
jgi:hypothetical protein